MSPPSRRRQHEVNATASPVRVGDGSQPLRQAVIRVLFATTLVALIAGGMAWLHRAHDVPGIFWATATLVAILPAVWWVLAALRRGRVGADIITVLALVGTLAIHEYLAGALIGVMLATGQALEVAAERRAAKDLRSLLKRAPALRVDGQRAACRRYRSTRSPSVMCSWWVPAKYFLWMRWSLRMGRFSTNRRSPVNPSTGLPKGQTVRSGAVNAGGAVEIAPQRRRMGAPTRALCEWLNRPRRKVPPWSALPIASPPGFCR